MIFSIGLVALSAGALIKQVALAPTLLVAGAAPWIILLGSWGRPGLFYVAWLRGESLPMRRQFVIAFWLAGAALLGALILVPISQQLGGYGSR